MTPAIEAEPARLAGTRRFSVAEYHRLTEAGISKSGDKVELLEGYIVYKAGYPELCATDTAFPEWRWLRPFTVAEYHRMFDLGVLDREEKLELLDGYLALKMAQNPPHRGATTRLMYALPTCLPPGWVCMVNGSVEAGLFEPEPDALVVRGALADYDARNLTPADFGIVIEVSDSTLEGDRNRKSRLFAKCAIPVYWIVNLVDRQIEVYSGPDAAAGDAVPLTLDGAAAGTVAVSELVP